jgi:hypothetical protein
MTPPKRRKERKGGKRGIKGKEMTPSKRRKAISFP